MSWGKRLHPGRHATAPRWALAIGSVGYIGFSPVASGTIASAVAAALYYALPPLQQNFILIGASLILMIAGSKAAAVIISAAGESDPSFVVSDEVVGQWLALVTPIYQGRLLFVLVAFVLFRLFDIAKPFPASYFERKRGGFHVMMDDVVAGIYANLMTHVCFWIFSIA